MKAIENILNKIEGNIEKQIEECGLSKVPEGQQYWEGATWVCDQIKSQLIIPKEGKPLTEEEAQKCYPDLCFCKGSSYFKGVCNTCGKYED